MTKDELIVLLNKSIKNFKENEEVLFSINVHERSMTHKFAEYIQVNLKEMGFDFIVDCEYNRYGLDPKEISLLKDIVGEEVSTASLDSKTVFPDIIIHKRGSEGPNMLVIEAKKDASKSSENKDIEKLKYIKNQFKYEHAVFLNFKTKEKAIIAEYVQSN